MSPAQRRLTRAAPHPAEGFTSDTVTVRGLSLHLRRRVDPAGADPAWVLLHGLAVSHRYLMPTAAALPGSVFVPDLPGFGLSGQTPRVLTTEQHAEVVAAWMDATGLTGVERARQLVRLPDRRRTRDPPPGPGRVAHPGRPDRRSRRADRRGPAPPVGARPAQRGPAAGADDRSPTSATPGRAACCGP